MGPRILRTKDDVLKEIWDRRISVLDPSDQVIWDENMIDILLEEGYSVKK